MCKIQPKDRWSSFTGRPHQRCFSMNWLFGEVGEFGLWWVESCTVIQKDWGGEGEGKTESFYRGLPVWETDLWAKPVFLSNFLKPFQNKQGSQIKQSRWVNTRPLNGYTLPELNFAFMATSKVRKITFFVSMVTIVPVTFADGQCFISTILDDALVLSSVFSEWILQCGT